MMVTAILPLIGGALFVVFLRWGAPLPSAEDMPTDSAVQAPSASDMEALETLPDTVLFPEWAFPVTHFSRRIVPATDGTVEMQRVTNWTSLVLTLLGTGLALAAFLAWLPRSGETETRNYLLEAVGVTVLAVAFLISLIGLVGTLATDHRVEAAPSGIRVETTKFFAMTSTKEIPRDRVARVQEGRGVLKILYRTGDGEVGTAVLPVMGSEERGRLAGVVRATLGRP